MARLFFPPVSLSIKYHSTVPAVTSQPSSCWSMSSETLLSSLTVGFDSVHALHSIAFWYLGNVSLVLCFLFFFFLFSFFSPPFGSKPLRTSSPHQIILRRHLVSNLETKASATHINETRPTPRSIIAIGSLGKADSDHSSSTEKEKRQPCLIGLFQ